MTHLLLLTALVAAFLFENLTFAQEVRDVSEAIVTQQDKTTDPTSKPSVLFNVGAATSRFSTSGNADNYSPASKMGLSYGVGANLPITPVSFGTVSFQPELNYTTKSFSLIESNDGEQLSATVHAYYFEIPALGRLTFLKDSKLRPYVIAGPSFGLLVSSEMDLNIANYSYTSDTTHLWKTFIVSGVIGTGADFDLSKELSVGLNVRYNKGLTNTISSNKNEVDLKINNYQFLTSLQIRI